MNAPVTTTHPLPTWRLDDLYKDRDDPRIAADLARAKEANDALVALKGKFVASRADAGGLGQLLDQGITLYEQAVNLLWGVGAFASLSSSTAQDDPAWGKFQADSGVKSSAIA